MIECANPQCENIFKQSKHNQKYCTPECCKVVTNTALMVEYYNRKARLSGKPRRCSVCEVTKLSRYNDTTVCSECVAKERTRQRVSLLDSLGLCG